MVWIGVNPEEQVIELQKEVDKRLSVFFRKENRFKVLYIFKKTKKNNLFKHDNNTIYHCLRDTNCLATAGYKCGSDFWTVLRY